MNVIYSRKFLEDASALPRKIQSKLDRLVACVAENPFHPLLHTKQLTGSLRQLYSFRITRDWRVIFHFDTADTIRFVAVGHRKDIYR
jgi:addiction module RelE/StbE family toxin